jgi:hypothetical protein
MIASSQGKTWPPQTLLSKRQRVALSLDIPVAEHTDQSDAYSATAEAARQERPNRARTIRLLSLVVSDIAEAELVGGSGRPGSLVSARSQTRRRGAATAHAQGYARPDEGSRARPRRPGRPLWAAGHGARRRDPGEVGRPQPAVLDLLFATTWDLRSFGGLTTSATDLSRLTVPMGHLRGQAPGPARLRRCGGAARPARARSRA